MSLSPSQQTLSVWVYVCCSVSLLRKVFCFMVKFLPHLEANESMVKLKLKLLASCGSGEYLCSVYATPGLKQEVCDRHTSG